jgi:hypothetical protein
MGEARIDEGQDGGQRREGCAQTRWTWPRPRRPGGCWRRIARASWPSPFNISGGALRDDGYAQGWRYGHPVDEPRTVDKLVAPRRKGTQETWQ